MSTTTTPAPATTRQPAPHEHRGHWGPLPADGKTETFTVLFIHRLEDGKLAERWRVSDDLDRARQLGGRLVPT